MPSNNRYADDPHLQPRPYHVSHDDPLAPPPPSRSRTRTMNGPFHHQHHPYFRPATPPKPSQQAQPRQHPAPPPHHDHDHDQSQHPQQHPHTNPQRHPPPMPAQQMPPPPTSLPPGPATWCDAEILAAVDDIARKQALRDSRPGDSYRQFMRRLEKRAKERPKKRRTSDDGPPRSSFALNFDFHPSNPPPPSPQPPPQPDARDDPVPRPSRRNSLPALPQPSTAPRPAAKKVASTNSLLHAAPIPPKPTLQKPLSKSSKRPSSVPNGSAAAAAALHLPGASHRPIQLTAFGNPEDDLAGSEEDEVPESDYISRLNEMSQKQVGISKLNFSGEQTRPSEQHGNIWFSVASCYVLPRRQNDEKIYIEGCGRKKMGARRKAAKRLFDFLSSTDLPAIKGRPEPSKQAHAAAPRANTSEKYTANTAARALHILCQDGHISESCTSDEAREGWKVVMTLKIANVGEREFSGVAAQKKLARFLAADQAFAELQRLEIPTIERFVHVKPTQMPESKKEPPATSREVRPSVALYDPSAKRDAVRYSDEESDALSVADSDNDEDGEVMLPDDFELAIARTDEECEQWLTEHIRANDNVGIYIDSRSARRAYSEDRGGTLKDTPFYHPAICISTKTHALLLQNVHSSSYSEEDPQEEMWVADSVADFLESSLVRKQGHTVDEGVSFLAEHYGIKSSMVGDVRSTSLAISGIPRISGGLFKTSLSALTDQWLRKELPSPSPEKLWNKGHKVAKKLTGKGGAEAAAAVMSAYVCMVLRDNWQPEARRKMVQAYGSGAQMKDLVEKILTRPS